MSSSRYLLDSNVLSEITKVTPNRALTQRLSESWTQCVTASVVLMELYCGALSTIETKRSKQYLVTYERWFKGEMPITVLPFDAAAAYWTAHEMARLQKIGLTRPWRDAQIAGIAAANNLTLVSRNVTDFKPFKGLKIENWFE